MPGQKELRFFGNLKSKSPLRELPADPGALLCSLQGFIKATLIEKGPGSEDKENSTYGLHQRHETESGSETEGFGDDTAEQNPETHSEIPGYQYR